MPPGFTITTEVCTHFYANAKTYPDGPEGAGRRRRSPGSKRASGARFGDADNPLLVSVRSGARASMPGMMDTVLNLGLNDATVEGLARRSGDPRFAYDSYRRFIQMYGHVVLGVEHHHFEELLENHKHDRGVSARYRAQGRGLEGGGRRLQGQGRGARARQALPAGPARAALGRHRRRVRLLDEPARHHLPPPARHPRDWGTAVNVQAMVFGNMGEDCATGVAFTRNPSTGDDEFYGEFWSTPRARTWSPASARRSI